MTNSIRRPRARRNAAIAAALALAALASPAALAGAGPAAAATVTVTSGAKSSPVTSLHWVGYTFPVSHVTGVRADWTEPRVTGRQGSEEFVWIGVGGWNQADNNIIQDGTFAYFPPGGGRNEGVWYERVPVNPEALFPLVPVGPGDRVTSSITLLPGRPNRWRMSLEDVTTGVKWALTVRFRSLETYPSFVVEDPNKGAASPDGPFYPFPRWRSVKFSAAEVRVRNTWVPISRLAAYRVDMVRGSRTLATAGSISKYSGFYARQR